MKAGTHETKHLLAVILIGFLVQFSSAVSAKAELEVPKGAAKLPEVDRASYPKNPHLVALEKSLRQIILHAQPEAKLEWISDYLEAHYRADKFRVHLTNFRGNISTEPAEQFPNDFSEFSLILGVEKDVMYYRPDARIHKEPETFGVTLTHRYNLKVLPDPALPEDVPREHWAYTEYDNLTKAGLVRKRFPEGIWHGQYVGMMTRYEFAVAIIQLHQNPVAQNTADNNRELHNAMIALQEEFAPEIANLGLHFKSIKPVVHGQTWQPRYEHLSLRFSYGKGVDEGVDAGFIKKIEQVIADYAAASLKKDTLVSNALEQK